MKLQSMTSFIEEQEKIILNEIEYPGTTSEDYKAMVQFITRVTNYSKFLRLPLTLEMFVPVDEEGNVLEEPSDYDYYVSDNEQYFQGDVDECMKYVEAKERVLFEGFTTIRNQDVENIELKLTIYMDTLQHVTDHGNSLGGGDLFGNTIEALAYAGLDIELTPSAIKSIGL